MLQSGGLHEQGAVSAQPEPGVLCGAPCPLPAPEVGAWVGSLLPWGKALESSPPIGAFLPKIITERSGSGGSRRHCVEVLPKS